ncbi:MAG TPA: molybdate ABC transporter substrate-binding protein [Steroidobacteraceae bacterium]|nr:molybdate ABC transporter substrate-binding protein [Steroidobacteraceae bacterium]
MRLQSLARALAGLAVLAVLLSPPAHAQEHEEPGLLVFAAASLSDVVGELSAVWEKSSHVPVKLSFAASSVLARQIEAGAAADVFVSADQEWMDYLATRKLIDAASRRDLVGNGLVLIAPADSRTKIEIVPGFRLADALAGGRLAIADPDTVPAGRYARAALTNLGVWEQVADRLVRAENVRSALTYVARGEAPIGIVYSTDARIEKRIRVLDSFPDDSHPPITYPAAATASARQPAVSYLAYLGSSEATIVWKKHGFREPRK